MGTAEGILLPDEVVLSDSMPGADAAPEAEDELERTDSAPPPPGAGASPSSPSPDAFVRNACNGVSSPLLSSCPDEDEALASKPFRSASTAGTATSSPPLVSRRREDCTSGTT